MPVLLFPVLSLYWRAIFWILPFLARSWIACFVISFFCASSTAEKTGIGGVGLVIGILYKFLSKSKIKLSFSDRVYLYFKVFFSPLSIDLFYYSNEDVSITDTKMFAYYVLSDFDTIIIVLQLRNMKTKVDIVWLFSIKFQMLNFVEQFFLIFHFFWCGKVSSSPGLVNRERLQFYLLHLWSSL